MHLESQIGRSVDTDEDRVPIGACVSEPGKVLNHSQESPLILLKSGIK